MHKKDSSSGDENQFSIDVSAFVSETISGTTIRLLRARPETQAALARQLDIPRRLELLRRCPRQRIQTGSSPSARFLQDCARVGETSAGETIFLVLSVIEDLPRWGGGWFLAVTPRDTEERFQCYLAASREAIVAELSHGLKGAP